MHSNWKLVLLFSAASAMTTTAIATTPFDSNPAITPSKSANICTIKYPITKKRQAFIERITRLIKQKNELIRKQRMGIIKLFKQGSDINAWNQKSRDYVNDLSTRYRITYNNGQVLKNKLLLKINIIPVDIVLAQAIVESQWGESRFYKEGNNLFGMHCFSSGCGIPPRGVKDPTFNVMRYPNDTASINSYFLNINRNQAYQNFRQVREKILQQTQNTTDNSNLIKALNTYSEMGGKYTQIIKGIINCRHHLLVKK
jgi:Bax protein